MHTPWVYSEGFSQRYLPPPITRTKAHTELGDCFHTISKNVPLVMLYKEILVKSHLGKIEVKYYNSNQTLVSLSLNDYSILSSNIQAPWDE